MNPLDTNQKDPNEPKSVYNPTTEDFTVQRADDDNVPHLYTLYAGEIGTFPSYIADHLIKHFAHHILMKRGVKTNYDDDLAKVKEEITVQL